MERPVTIRGVEYESLSEAARDLGITVSAISHAIRRGTVERVGLGLRGDHLTGRRREASNG